MARRSLVAECFITASPQYVPARQLAYRAVPSDLGVTRSTDFTLPGSSPSFVRSMQQKGWETALIGKTHWHPHTAGVDLRDKNELLEQQGFDKAVEIAGPRALAEVH